MSVQEPKTYWEKRCLLNEEVLDSVLKLLEYNFPFLDTGYIRNAWQDSIDQINLQDWE